ncbi:nucleoside-diphosphate-sugar epimerase [Saonia flava]|uniref:Nucleoside-diphosphate-sugar epimerase n=1 Tax=Saonia flava TaxID=523696 RepID=A0A846QW32_9FLAO|nr:NAD-dependent epimerase/dehydratase family protein [Saonia flava]NJB71140.1 nucleoside-diphosphate-sugar epimerase [Saonia flava]
MVLVTGGTGLVGAHLLFHLANKGLKVKAIHRKQSDLRRVEKVFSYYSNDATALFKKIMWIEADLDNIPTLEIAFTNVTHVYHAAALISFDPRNYKKLRKVNVKGTRNIVNLCLAYGIKKLCYVSTIGAIGRSINGESMTEETEWNDAHTNVYALTKYDAEMEVWRGSQEGLDMVMVNPGIVLGPGFWKYGSGKFFSIAAKGQRIYPPSGTGFITVNDVVKMMVSLMESPIKNERFIAVSENLTYKKVVAIIAKELGKPGPKNKLKLWQLEILWRLDWVRTVLTGKERKLTKNGVFSLRKRRVYNNTKIQKYFPFEYESIEEALIFSSKHFLKEVS